MENPFEIISQRLEAIEKELSEIRKAVIKPVITEKKEWVFKEYVERHADKFKESTLYRFTSSKEIPHKKWGRKIYFDQKSEDWINSRYRNLSHEETQRKVDQFLAKQKRK